MELIYFDNQSTTMLTNDVISVMTEAMESGYGNPASQHEFGRIARQQLEQCRERISSALGLSRSDRCLFTSGGTEANNLAIFGHFPDGFDWSGANLVCSAIEHPSVLAVLDHLKSRGIEVRLVNPDQSGRVRSSDFDVQIDEKTRLVICMWVNNETGVIQPVEEIASICRRRQLPFHVDAVQGIGKCSFRFEEMGCSTVALSGHKIHGPTGIGLLLISDHFQLSPRLFGGFQQDGIRPGTESIPLAAGLRQAIEQCSSSLQKNVLQLKSLRDYFEEKMLASFPGISINGSDSPRSPNASNISFPQIDRQQFILAADRLGLACSTGSACSSGSSQPSHVLTAMGCKKNLISGAIRFGFSTLNRLSEVDTAIERIRLIVTAKKP